MSGRYVVRFNEMDENIYCENCETHLMSKIPLEVYVCLSACPQKTPNLRSGFRKRRLPENTPRRHRFADGQLT